MKIVNLKSLNIYFLGVLRDTVDCRLTSIGMSAEANTTLKLHFRVKTCWNALTDMHNSEEYKIFELIAENLP